MATQVAEIRRLGLVARVLDYILMPFMYVIGRLSGRPMRTHPWNRQLLTKEEANRLNFSDGVVRHEGVKGSLRPWGKWDPRPHLPIINGWGWRHYAVLALDSQIKDFAEKKYFIGWKTEQDWGGEVAVSQLPLKGSVRMLIGSGSVTWFALDEWGFRLPLELIAEGELSGPLHRKIPLR